MPQYSCRLWATVLAIVSTHLPDSFDLLLIHASLEFCLSAPKPSDRALFHSKAAVLGASCSCPSGPVYSFRALAGQPIKSGHLRTLSKCKLPAACPVAVYTYPAQVRPAASVTWGSIQKRDYQVHAITDKQSFLAGSLTQLSVKVVCYGVFNTYVCKIGDESFVTGSPNTDVCRISDTCL